MTATTAGTSGTTQSTTCAMSRWHTAECIVCDWRYQDVLDWLVWHEARTHVATLNMGIWRSGNVKFPERPTPEQGVLEL